MSANPLVRIRELLDGRRTALRQRKAVQTATRQRTPRADGLSLAQPAPTPGPQHASRETRFGRRRGW
jgi:hypothetical protein